MYVHIVRSVDFHLEIQGVNTFRRCCGQSAIPNADSGVVCELIILFPEIYVRFSSPGTVALSCRCGGEFYPKIIFERVLFAGWFFSSSLFLGHCPPPRKIVRVMSQLPKLFKKVNGPLYCREPCDDSVSTDRQCSRGV